MHEVAADQPVGEPLLEGLVDQASRPGEVLLTAVEEVPEADLLGRCPLLLHGVPHPDQRIGTWFACARGRLDQFNLPHPVPAVAPRLLQDPDLAPGQGPGEPGPEIGGVHVEVGIGSLAEVAGPVEHFLGAERADHVRVGRDPHAAGRGLAEEHIQTGPVSHRPGWG
jgi:hypothetical protein